ncbi:MAG: M48 family metallopeptidase [Gammaproteobacteria bacterium]|nr:M48 family metallopeptidase [Gammaproteobacteria bacterium]
MTDFTTLFLVVLGLGLGVQLWLLQRHANHVAANQNAIPDQFSGQISLEAHQKAAAYTLTKIGVQRLELVYETILLLLWTLGGGLALLNGYWAQTGLSSIVIGLGLIFSLLLIQGGLSLPFSLWRTFVIETRFGFNKTTPKRFVTDLLLSLTLAVMLGTPLLFAILWLMEHAGQSWWIWVWLVWMGFSLFISWIFPTVIAPIFNKFTPIEEGPLKARIQQLLSRCGFNSKGIFIMDGSRRSGHGNAYFTGFGKNKRIVFFDTLVESLEPEELEAVLAHELGHFKHKHVLKHLLLSAVAALIGLFALSWLANWPPFYTSLGVSEQSNALALVLFLMVVPVFTQFITPLFSALSRRHEFEADDFAVAQTSREPMIRALVKLYRENANTLTPDPLYSAFHDSHPPAPVRIGHLSSTIPDKSVRA